jgi:hypothetical protein
MVMGSSGLSRNIDEYGEKKDAQAQHDAERAIDSARELGCMATARSCTSASASGTMR